jgi:hypothetical protein
MFKRNLQDVGCAGVLNRRQKDASRTAVEAILCFLRDLLFKLRGCGYAALGPLW